MRGSNIVLVLVLIVAGVLAGIYFYSGKIDTFADKKQDQFRRLLPKTRFYTKDGKYYMEWTGGMYSNPKTTELTEDRFNEFTMQYPGGTATGHLTA